MKFYSDIIPDTAIVARDESRKQWSYGFPGANISAKDFTSNMPRGAVDTQAWSAFVGSDAGPLEDSLANIPRKKQPSWVKALGAVDPKDEGDR